MIGIRADSGGTVGAGHMVRCLAIAERLRAAQPVFFCAQGSSMAQEAGFTCVPLADTCGETLANALRGHGITTVLLDIYDTDECFYSALREFRLAVLYDCGYQDMWCDLLVDYNINSDTYTFPNAMRMLLGPGYAPLRTAFEHVPAYMPRPPANVLVTAGGSDPVGSTLPVVRALHGDARLSHLRIDVVVGGMNERAGEIERAAGALPRVVVHRNVRDMAALMRYADIAVSAGGVTLYEICACGLPCVAYSIVENQDAMVERMAKERAMISAGVYKADNNACLVKIVNSVADLCTKMELTTMLSTTAQKLVDGGGAQRIAAALLELDSSCTTR